MLKGSSQKGGYTFKLPTEAEWEYACRSGGRPEKYAGGDNADAVAWHGRNSRSRTHPVGEKSPNGLGIYDMSGNALEWCQDWYDENYYSSSPKDNPQGASGYRYRVFRGGYTNFDASSMRCAIRSGYDAVYDRGFGLGFRLVRVSRQ